MLPIGVLALQGDFREHIATLKTLGIEAIEVRKPEQLNGLAGLIIPGGESTVIDKLSRIFAVREPLIEMIRAGFPVFGTCAGLIMLADTIVDGIAGQQSFGGLNISVQRNAFGSQVDSFETELDFAGTSGIKAAFIRAPLVTSVGPSVEVLSKLSESQIVAVRQGNLLGISFHPEVTGETRVHEYFVQMCKDADFKLAK